jgi:Tfp pilus assembly protein PilF
MARDETGLGIRQATCRDFLDILWDSADLGELKLEPDRALGEIRDAMRQGRISEARDRIEEQLGIVGPVVTYARYLSPRERAGQPLIERIHEYACELSTLAGKMELDARQWSPARQHLLRAIVASPGNDLPRAHLVELYVETGEYRAARELLAAISTGRGFCPELFNLGVDILKRGAREDARQCFRQVADRDEIGTFRSLASRLLERTETGIPRPPSQQDLDRLLESGVRSLQRGDVAGAVEHFHEHLAVSPRSEIGWLNLGLTYQAGGRVAAMEETFPPVDPADRREVDLRRAEEALWHASVLEPRLAESHLALASVRLELGLSAPAIEAARNAMRFAIRGGGFLGLLSQVLAQAGQLDDAAKAAQVALEEDPDQPDALKTLAQLESAGGQGEER